MTLISINPKYDRMNTTQGINRKGLNSKIIIPAIIKEVADISKKPSNCLILKWQTSLSDNPQSWQFSALQV